MILLAEARAAMVVPWRWAMPERVSPARTVMVPPVLVLFWPLLFWLLLLLPAFWLPEVEVALVPGRVSFWPG